MTPPWLQAVEAEFAERLRSGRLAHALLISGSADCGKTELAKAFMASVLCLENTYPACGKCRSCQLAATGAHPDGHVITFEENPKTGELRKELVIEQVRRLTSSMFLTNTISQRKSALVYPAEAMNRSTANALLKTLEEPQGEAVLILVSHAPGRLLATIRSRCQALPVRQPDFAAALNWLSSEMGLSESDADLALKAAAGSPFRALRMAQDGGTEQYRQVHQLLQGLRNGQAGTGQAMKELAEVDPDRLWAWMSLLSANLSRSLAAQGKAVKSVLDLQRQADRNRGLARTPVRKDLLLQDWLIQWSELRP
jgi:DNA polymerase-3 subunit delta'